MVNKPWIETLERCVGAARFQRDIGVRLNTPETHKPAGFWKFFLHQFLNYFLNNLT